MTAQLMMLQGEIDANPARWKDARRTGITASEIASVIGLAPATQSSAWKLFAAKTTGEHFDADTDATLRGTHLEPYVAARFKEVRPDLHVISGGLFRSSDRPWQMATFDRFAYDDGHAAAWSAYPVQLKTAINKFDGDGNLVWGDPGTDEIPVHYRAQVLYEMDVADAEQALVPCLFMDTWKMHVYQLTRTADAEADILAMRAAAEEFLDRIERDDPPPVDWSPATTAALKTLYSAEPAGTARIPAKLARRYKRTRAAKKAAERRFDQTVNEMLAIAGDAKYIVTGDRPVRSSDQNVTVATRTRSPRRTVNAELLRKSHPAIAKEVERVTDVTALRSGKWARGE